MSDYKFYDLGVVVGRFAPIHLGHESLFKQSMLFCKRTLILVGSAQESGTLRNPFRVETRIKAIREAFPGKSEKELMIYGIDDLTNEYDVTSAWGKFVKENIETHCHKFANLMVYGNDEFRSHWFDAADLKGTAEMIIPRSTIEVSGTEVRGYLTIDDEKAWQEATPSLIHGMYSELRTELMSVPVYRQIYDEVRKTDMTIDDFMRIYSKYEAEDRAKKEAALKK